MNREPEAPRRERGLPTAVCTYPAPVPGRALAAMTGRRVCVVDAGERIDFLAELVGRAASGCAEVQPANGGSVKRVNAARVCYHPHETQPLLTLRRATLEDLTRVLVWGDPVPLLAPVGDVVSLSWSVLRAPQPPHLATVPHLAARLEAWRSVLDLMNHAREHWPDHDGLPGRRARGQVKAAVKSSRRLYAMAQNDASRRR